MKELDLALTVLNNDLDNDVPFADALREVFVADPTIRDLRSAVAGLVGCALRHHLLFSYLTRGLSDFTVEEKRLVALALGNDYFYRHFPVEEMNAALKEALGEGKFALALPLLENAPDASKLIPESISRTSNLYLSLRYNIPEFALRIFQREGHGAAYRTVRAWNLPFVSTVRATGRLSEEDFKSLSLEPTSVPGVYQYRGKVALRKNEAYRRHDVFDERPYVKMLFDEMKVSELENVMLYVGQPDMEWENEMLESMSIHTNVNIGVEHFDQKVNITRLIKQRDLHNVNFFAVENPDEMLAAISHQCDVVFVIPNSSMFDRIPSTPDYLLHYSRETMDPIYEKQLPVLTGCAKHVAEGGSLVYAIPTISRREGHRVVAEFLANHKEFTLDKEVQLLPFQGDHVAFYYAVLYKGEKAKVTDNAPIVDFMSQPESPVSSAKADQ